jgi:hypothetical protein
MLGGFGKGVARIAFVYLFMVDSSCSFLVDVLSWVREDSKVKSAACPSSNIAGFSLAEIGLDEDPAFWGWIEEAEDLGDGLEVETFPCGIGMGCPAKGLCAVWGLAKAEGPPLGEGIKIVTDGFLELPYL